MVTYLFECIANSAQLTHGSSTSSGNNNNNHDDNDNDNNDDDDDATTTTAIAEDPVPELVFMPVKSTGPVSLNVHETAMLFCIVLLSASSTNPVRETAMDF